MPLFTLFFCLFLSLVWPGIFNVLLLLVILVGPNCIHKMGFLVMLDFMQDLFYLGYVTTQRELNYKQFSSPWTTISFSLFFTRPKILSDLNITELFVVNWFFKCTCRFFFALCKWSFNNYVDENQTNFDPLPPRVDKGGNLRTPLPPALSTWTIVLTFVDDFTLNSDNMAIRVVEFSNGVYKIRKIFA